MTKQVECPQCLELVSEQLIHGICESCDMERDTVVKAGIGLTSALFL